MHEEEEKISSPHKGERIAEERSGEDDLAEAIALSMKRDKKIEAETRETKQPKKTPSSVSEVTHSVLSLHECKLIYNFSDSTDFRS